MVIALIGGGARSGKSRFARQYAEERFERLALVATAQALDEEMAERIALHRAERSSRWTTFEEPFDVAGVMRQHEQDFDVFLVDCLTLWLSNVMLACPDEAERRIDSLLAGLASGPPLIAVTNEVGCGIVPENPLARRFRDLAGILNHRVAAISREVYWMAFGLPLKLR